MSTTREEFQHALQDIAYHAPSLNSPFDRVRLVEWVRRLSTEAGHSDPDCMVVNPYAQLLRIQVRGGHLQSPFLLPPSTESIPELAVCLGQEELNRVPTLPPPGSTAPFMCRKTKDGHVYVAARQIPGKGVLCYLAVSTQNLNSSIP